VTDQKKTEPVDGGTALKIDSAVEESTVAKWQAEMDARHFKVTHDAMLAAMLAYAASTKAPAPAPKAEEKVDAEQVEAIARVAYTAHEEQQAIDEGLRYEQIVRWEDLNPTGRDAWCAKVAHVLTMKHWESNVSAAELHDRWLFNRIRNGGKSPDPFFRPWSMLTAAQQSRSRLIVEVIGALWRWHEPAAEVEAEEGTPAAS